MNSLLILAIIAVTTTFSGYLINQLPAFRDFPGKNIYIFRLLGSVMALGIVLTALSNEDLSQKFSWLKTGALLILTFPVKFG
jgi:hypothetical protein